MLTLANDRSRKCHIGNSPPKEVAQFVVSSADDGGWNVLSAPQRCTHRGACCVYNVSELFCASEQGVSKYVFLLKDGYHVCVCVCTSAAAPVMYILLLSACARCLLTVVR